MRDGRGEYCHAAFRGACMRDGDGAPDTVEGLEVPTALVRS